MGKLNLWRRIGTEGQIDTADGRKWRKRLKKEGRDGGGRGNV